MPEETPPQPAALEPGFHVMLDGESIGCYPTKEDAEAFANGHPRAEGLKVSIKRIAG